MIAILIGTRPELIKMAPVMRELDNQNLPYIFIHSNQHYSQNMDGVFIDELMLRQPDYNLNVGSASHAIQTGKVLQGVEQVINERKPKILLVHGDTNTTLSGALAARKMHIDVGHIEAGLRSHDYNMPEEINRILTDRLSTYLFAPTNEAKKNLQKEGIRGTQVIVTGNTVVDALHQHISLTANCTILKGLSVDKNNYILVTAHRAETVDQKETLQQLLDLLTYVMRKTNLPIVLPLHPRTESKLQEFGLTLPGDIKILEPVSYIEMLTLLQNANLVLTDSGGLQEEAYALKKPLMTLRDSTERPETLSANFLIHLDPLAFDQALKAYSEERISWSDKFGTGRAAKKIVKTIKHYSKEK